MFASSCLAQDILLFLSLTGYRRQACSEGKSWVILVQSRAAVRGRAEALLWAHQATRMAVGIKSEQKTELTARKDSRERKEPECHGLLLRSLQQFPTLGTEPFTQGSWRKKQHPDIREYTKLYPYVFDYLLSLKQNEANNQL